MRARRALLCCFSFPLLACSQDGPATGQLDEGGPCAESSAHVGEVEDAKGGGREGGGGEGDARNSSTEGARGHTGRAKHVPHGTLPLAREGREAHRVQPRAWALPAARRRAVTIISALLGLCHRHRRTQRHAAVLILHHFVRCGPRGATRFASAPKPHRTVRPSHVRQRDATPFFCTLRAPSWSGSSVLRLTSALEGSHERGEGGAGTKCTCTCVCVCVCVCVVWQLLCVTDLKKKERKRKRSVRAIGT